MNGSGIEKLLGAALKGVTCSHVLKEELHNRFNLISEERVNIFKHNSENLMKIG